MAECCCGSGDKVRLVYACSGEANTGLPADSVARRLAKLGIALRPIVLSDYDVPEGKDEITAELAAKTAFRLAEEVPGESEAL